jgi:ATP-binding cassette subfamily A (ABC1) protein 3
MLMLYRVMFLLYFISYMSVLTYSPSNLIDRDVNIVYFAIALITPAGNLIRSMFVALNVFSIICRNELDASYPGEITLYGGPILYLIGQSLFLFGILIWWDSGPLFRKFRKTFRPTDEEESDMVEEEVTNELTRVTSSNDGLRVLHVTKTYGRNVAVQDVTFGVSRGEVFALLGPNGAGKSTTISLIRGDIQPRKGGEIFVENVSVGKHRAAARSHLGVCPQFDAMDQMTVIEHLRFYARVRGVPDIEHNVREVIRAVGLEPYVDRMAAKLSGGNKRKLSLAIALMGNPTVLLLDEPSSGMDAASKRVMWRTLASVVPGRSLVLTTHSMEEADALANRAGIMARKMLALGTTDYLRRKHGDAYHVHLVHSGAPHTDDETMDKIRGWVMANFAGAVVEDKTYHGQLRFSVPANTRKLSLAKTRSKEDEDKISNHDAYNSEKSGGIASLFTMLERHKQELGFEYYSVSQTTLDQVFLSIVKGVEEENYSENWNHGLVTEPSRGCLCRF